MLDGELPSIPNESRDGESQRRRVLDAMTSLAGEQGYAAASVALVIKRARVSRRTFYELFDSIEDCFACVLDEGLQRTGSLIAEAFKREGSWEDGVRAALTDLLVFFDSEPLLARVWLIEAVAAGSWAFERRERNVAVLRALIVDHWIPPDRLAPASPPPDSLPVVGVMAAVLGIIHTHLITRQPEPLIVLLGPLMGLVTAPYLDARASAREVARGKEITHTLLLAPYPPPRWPLGGEGMVEIPDALRDPRAHRARRCLLHLAVYPGCSNREIADGVGISSHTQISTLLRRLCEMGLLSKRQGRSGQANAWALSEAGAQVASAVAGLEGERSVAVEGSGGEKT
jgi:AcrR family transcriptional regulator